MNEELEIRGPSEEQKGLLRKWLKVLLYIQIANAVRIGFGMVFPSTGIEKWLSLMIAAPSVYVLYQLAPVCSRYRTAAIMYGVSMIGTFVKADGLSTLISVCGLVARYQEYAGHGDVTQGTDDWLSGKWHSLFLLEMIVSVITVVGLSVGVLIGVDAGTESNVLVKLLSSLGIGITLIVRIIYLTYLNKTVKLFTE